MCRRIARDTPNVRVWPLNTDSSGGEGANPRDLYGSGKQHPTTHPKDHYSNLTPRNKISGGAPARGRLQQEKACLGAEHRFGRGDWWRRSSRRRLVVLLVIVRRCRGGGGWRRRRSALFENPLTLGQAFHAGQTVRGRCARRVRLGQRRRGRRFGYSAAVDAVAAAFAVYHNNISISPRESATTTTRN